MQTAMYLVLGLIVAALVLGYLRLQRQIDGLRREHREAETRLHLLRARVSIIEGATGSALVLSGAALWTAVQSGSEDLVGLALDSIEMTLRKGAIPDQQDVKSLGENLSMVDRRMQDRVEAVRALIMEAHQRRR